MFQAATCLRRVIIMLPRPNDAGEIVGPERLYPGGIGSEPLTSPSVSKRWPCGTYFVVSATAAPSLPPGTTLAPATPAPASAGG